jgi:hypothetical protein
MSHTGSVLGPAHARSAPVQDGITGKVKGMGSYRGRVPMGQASDAQIPRSVEGPTQGHL